MSEAQRLGENVLTLASAGVTPALQASAHRLDRAILDAIEAARVDGCPRGIVVALLHAHAHQQTAFLVEGT